jgi:large subunit ribosomal protein L4e
MDKKINVLGLDGNEKELIDLPKVFSIMPRFDLIKRAVISTEAAQKQPQGRDPLAGKRNTAEGWGTGFAAARVPRLKGSGYPNARNAGFAPMVVGGRQTHPPRSEKITIKKINKKEKYIALLSAISATEKRELVIRRGHKVEKLSVLPIVIDDKLQTIKKTSQIIDILDKLGLKAELDRVKDSVTIRAGKGKRRGRKYKKRKGPLIVIKDNFGIYKAARNIPGLDIINIDNINCNVLAPGTHCGRLTIWTQSAFNSLNKLEVR